MSGTLTGSSVHGEHPKFTVTLKDDCAKQAAEQAEMIVKFSPFVNGPIGRRWGDLLIAEHHAHQVLNQAGVLACDSEIIESAGRIFLEVRRFDRRAAEGRIGVSSFLAIDNGLVGGSKNWLEATISLRVMKRIDEATVETVRFVSTFGALIANTDRHLGNLACFDGYYGKFNLAPIYDMLPMLFAPSHDELVARVYEPPEPTSATMRAWGKARDVAEKYWQVLTQDERISGGFRDICSACLSMLKAQPRTGAYAYKG